MELFTPTGISGYQAAGNVIGWEFNPELNGVTKFATFKKMIADPQLAGNIALFESALVNASIQFVGGREDIREFIAKAYPQDELRNFVSHAMDYLWYGCALFEMVPYFDRPTKKVLERSYPRQTWTVTGWDVNPKTKELVGVRQSGLNGYGYIPSNRLVLFVNKPDGDNYEGISLLRSCYGPWKAKWDQRRLDILGAQRYSAGIPYVKMTENATAQQVVDAKALASKLSSGVGAYIVSNPKDGIESIELIQMSGRTYDAEPKVKEYNIEMSRALLGQFMSFTAGSLGGEQLVREMIQLFYGSVQAIANKIARVMDLQKFHRVIDWNYNGLADGDYPQLEISGINKPDAASIGQFLNQVATAVPGFTAALTAKDYDIIKRAGGLTGYTEETAQAEPATIDADKTDQTNLSAGCNCGKVHKFSAGRALFSWEMRCDFSAMSAKMDAEASDIQSGLKPIVERMTDQYVKYLTPIIQKGDLDGVNKMDPRLIDLIEFVMRENAGDLFDAGMESVRNELGGATKLAARKVPAEKLRRAALDQAADAGATISKASADAAKQAARRAIQSGLVDEAQIGLTLRIAIDAVSESLSRKAAQGTAAGAFTNGRDAEAQDYDVKKTWYSAIMDVNTCESCAEYDGKEVINNEPAAPNPECYSTASGQNFCRCIWVYEV